MSISSGKLDSLLNESFAIADLSSVSLQSAVTNPITINFTGYAYFSVNLNTTGQSFAIPGEVVNVVGINDTDNSITVNLAANGQNILQETFLVAGFNSSDLLLFSGGNPTTFASSLTLGPVSSINSAVNVLSFSPLPSGTNLTFTPTGVVDPPPPAVHPGPVTVLDTTTGQPVSATGQPYTGPVSGLQEQYINITTDSLNITATTPNWFIHSGSGTDAIAVSSGTNVLDGGTGSNFLTGGSGTDTFFLDDRSPAADVFSTVVGFHSGDNATVFGVNPTDFVVNKFDNQGAAGFTGLDFGFSAPGRVNANVVLSGFSSADLSNGRLTVTFGTTPDLPGLPGSQYLLIHAN